MVDWVIHYHIQIIVVLSSIGVFSLIYGFWPQSKKKNVTTEKISQRRVKKATKGFMK